MKTILLASSSTSFLERNKSLLTRTGTRVLTATSGPDALKVHRDEKVDVIIAELAIPGLEGDALSTLVREDEELKNVSIILACHDNPADLRRVASCGANTWIVRPMTPEGLLESVTRLLAISTRKHYRIPLKAEAYAFKAQKCFFCSILNLSTSGMLIETGEMLRLGDRISCTFSFDGSSWTVPVGETVRTIRKPGSRYQYGIRYIDLPSTTCEQIEGLITSLRGEGSD